MVIVILLWVIDVSNNIQNPSRSYTTAALLCSNTIAHTSVLVQYELYLLILYFIFKHKKVTRSTQNIEYCAKADM